jgi:hypothetical protein
MIKRNFLLFIGFILLIAVAGPPVQAGEKKVRVNWRWAGTFFEVAQADSPDAALIFHTEAKGPPGSATISGVNQGPGTGNIPAADLAGCFDGADIKLIPILDPAVEQNENSLAATFKDLSVLNMALDETRLEEAFNCIRFSDSRFDFVVPIKFTGGFGRFEGATGEGIIRGQSMPVIPGSNLGIEIGTITGTIILP